MLTGSAETLVRTARSGGLHHALILHGPSFELLEAVAAELARALNCLRDDDPGGECAACSRIRRGLHPDVHEIRLEANRKMISIDQIRAMIGEATLKPYEGRTKVFIVSPADAMSTQAANSLLKTLEEPTRGTVFLLLTRSADRMLTTIRSRAQSIPVRPQMQRLDEIGRDLPLQEARLRATATSDDEAAARVAAARQVLVLLGEAAQGEALAAIELASLIAASEDPASLAAVAAQVLRDVAGESPSGSIDPVHTRKIAEALSPDLLLSVARNLLERADWSRVNPDPRFLYEAPLLDLVLLRS